jgi:hypothetical protein
MATLPIWHGQHDGFASRARKPLWFLAFCSACSKASGWLVIVQARVAGRGILCCCVCLFLDLKEAF